MKFCIINVNLYWEDPLNSLMLFLTKIETEGFIQQFHEGISGVYYSLRETTYKILRESFHWSRLFSHVRVKVRSCIP